MQESLILFTAIAALAVPAVAIAALVMAYKTARRFDELERRLHSLSREVRSARVNSGEAGAPPAEVGNDGGDDSHVGAASSPGAEAERRGYSFSFLEEKPQWEDASAEGATGEKASEPESYASGRDPGPGARKRARRRGRRGRRRNG